MRSVTAFLLLICLLLPALLTAEPPCNATSNITSTGGGRPIRANRTAEVAGNITNVPILPPFPTPTLNATQIGCPEEDAVCPVVDFHFLACLTQRHLMSTSDSASCPSNASFPNITANASVQFPLPVTYRCYNKTTHCCVNGYFLCPSNASSLCGVQCYNPANYTCYTTYSLCPEEAPMKCGESCFSTDQYSCESGQLVGVNATAGGNASSSNEQRYTELNVFSLPIQPAARRLNVLRPRLD